MNQQNIQSQAEQFIDLMPRLIRRLYRLDVEDPAMDLPVAQIRVCTILRDGPQCMSTISRELGITHSAMTQIADRLERQGMVERICETDDRRVKCLKLTPHGRDVMLRRKEKRLQRVRQVMEQLSEEDREQLIASLQSLWDAASVNPEESVHLTSEQLELI